MSNGDIKKPRASTRKRSNAIKNFRCKNLIAVIENPVDIGNIGTVVRNANALGVEKVYIVDPLNALPSDWQDMRESRPISKTSASSIKWTFVKRFDSTDECIKHLEEMDYISVVTSPHVKGKANAYLHEADYTKFAKLAIWFGNENRGITDHAIESCEMCITIPMFGMVESMNLGTSSGIVLYEVTKQRRLYQSMFVRSGQREKRVEQLPTEMPREDGSS
jgi:tRNA (guanosine-2'-O-)-methyltransferase